MHSHRRRMREQSHSATWRRLRHWLVTGSSRAINQRNIRSRAAIGTRLLAPAELALAHTLNTRSALLLLTLRDISRHAACRQPLRIIARKKPRFSPEFCFVRPLARDWRSASPIRPLGSPAVSRALTVYAFICPTRLATCRLTLVNQLLGFFVCLVDIRCLAISRLVRFPGSNPRPC